MIRVISVVVLLISIGKCMDLNKLSTRIIGGKPVQIGEFKNQVSLQTQHRMHLCGGILLDSRSVLTAAHCFKPSDPIVYVMGGDNSISSVPSPSRQVRKVEALVLYFDYNESRLQNDLAYIRLEKPFNITTNFTPAVLSDEPPSVGQKCSVVGWGFTENSLDDELSEDLLKVEVEVISTEFCNGTDSYTKLMQEGMFCAGAVEGGKDSCQGDSGGLISCAPNIVSGVVSFGMGCGLPNYPGVYTDLSKDMYKNWIEQIMEIEDLTELIDDYDEELEQNISSTDDLDAPNTEPTATTTTETTSTPWFDKPISNAIACADIMNMYFYLLLILISYFGIFIEI